MLKRLYVHNYKCLVNFEISFDKDISLFLGANGSGKSTIFEVLDKLRRFIVNEEKIHDVFDEKDSSRFLNECAIAFELEFEQEKNKFVYFLEIDVSLVTFINKECFEINKKKVFSFDKNSISYNEKDEQIDFFIIERTLTRYNFEISHKIDILLKSLSKLFINRINPYQIISSFDKTNSKIKVDFSNFAEWFSHLNETNRRGVSKFENEIRDVLNGFDYFRIELAGRAKILQVDFKNKTGKGIITYDFSELSEGQKVLISLYTLIYCTPDNSVLCIDEPENFLALPEIQPWLNALRDQCSERNLQVILISHHPSLINFLTANSGYWFSREDNHTRVQRIKDKNEGGLSFAQLIELGWIYEG